MKIRFDFVTNSSSSSFVAFNIKNKELAKICRKYWIPVNNDGTTIEGVWGAEEGDEVVGTPGGGSIADWFIRMLDPKQNYVYEVYDNDFSEAQEYLNQHRKEIDEATEKSEIASAHVVTDGDGTSVGIEVREKGTIQLFGIDEYDWDYQKMGEALWQVLDGWVMDSFLPKLKKFAEETGQIKERPDIWYKEESEDSIYDLYQPSQSLKGKKCCLTGDFAYGPKSKVEKYLTHLGATMSSSMTKTIQVLIVGSLGSPAWSHNNYGSKVEKAMQYRSKGADIIIIRESDLFADDPTFTGKTKAIAANKPEEDEEAKRKKELERYYRELDRHNRVASFVEGDGDTWMKNYGHLIDKLDYIDLNGKNVVISGEHPVYDRLESFGATVRNRSVSGKTDYLFVEPFSSGYGKIETVKELREKGNTRVKVVRASDLADLIEAGKYYSTAMAEADSEREAEERKQRVTSNEKVNLEQMSVYDAICFLQSEEECWDFLEELISLKVLKKYEQRAQLANLLDCNATYKEIGKKTGASTATISSVNRVLQQDEKFHNCIINNRANREASTKDYFTKLITGIKSVEECEHFFSCLCGPAECQMMELRFSIAKHLYQGKTYTQVTTETGASSATIGRVKSIIDNDSSLIWDVLQRIESDELATAYAEESAVENRIEFKALFEDEEHFERAGATSEEKEVPSEEMEVENMVTSEDSQTHIMIGKNDQRHASKQHLLIDGKLVFKDRVKVPGQNWSIGVPEGFVFSIDPSVNGKNTSNPSGVYDLILIKHNSRNKANFISPYRNAISFVTLDYTTIPKVQSMLRESKEYEWIADGEDLSIILVPLMSHPGINSFDVYVSSQMHIRKCQLIINGPYEKTETMEFAQQLLKSIEIDEERDELNDESAYQQTKIERSNIEYEGNFETVVVDDTWVIDIPSGYKYCTDKEIIGGHRNIIIMEDLEGNDFRDPFLASVSFTSMYSDSGDFPATEMAKKKAGFMGGDKKIVIKDEKDLYVSYYFDSSNIIDGDKLDVFKIDIGCGNGMSNIQVFFNKSTDTQKNQEKLVAFVAKSIRLSKPVEESIRQVVSKQEKAEVKHSSVPKTRVIARSNHNISMWGFTASEVPSVRKKLIDNNKGYPIRFMPYSAMKKIWEHDMSLFQYHCSLHSPEYFDNVNSILDHAEKYSTIFSADGTSADIKAGKLRNSAPIHALRSLIWTAAEMQDGKIKSSFPSDAPEDMWIDLAAFIGMHKYANYTPVNKKTKRFGAALLRKEEVRSIYTDVCGTDNSKFHYQDDPTGKTMANASISSLFQLVVVLIQTMPIMDLYYNYLEEIGNDNADLTGALKTILMGWSTFAFACRQPFFIVPGEYCTEDKDMSSALSWAMPQEVTETSDGMFTLYGTEIIKAKKCGQEVIIPDGVTGIITNDDTISGLKSAFANINKIVYPKSYTGPIVIPSKAKEVEVFGDPEIIMTNKCLCDGTPRIEKLTFFGKPKSVDDRAFSSLDFLKEIILPEGVEKLYDEAFYGWYSHGKVFLPESLNSIDDNVFKQYTIDEDVTIYVYKDCPVKNEIRKQLDEHKKYCAESNRKYPGSSYNRTYNIKLIEQESPWSIRAESFVSELCHLRDKMGKPDVSTENIKEIFVKTIGTSDDFSKCKRFIASNASRESLLLLVELVKNSEDDQQLYESLPGEIAEDINQQISNRIRKEKQYKFAEIKALSESSNIDNINKAIEMLEDFEYDGVNTDLMIEESLKKIETIKAARYSEAESLVSIGTISLISAALGLMKSIDPYKDTSEKIKAYKILLDKETEYEMAVSSMQHADPQSIKYIKNKFEGLGDYKDSESKAIECSNIIDALVDENNEKAKVLLESEDDDSFNKALDVYKHLASIDEDNGRIQLYLKKIASIDEILELKSNLKKHEEEHAMLHGFFKKKKRLEVEEKIRQVKEKIDGIKSTL